MTLRRPGAIGVCEARTQGLTGGGHTHFRCDVTFASGLTDEVIVHALPRGELFFKSTER